MYAVLLKHESLGAEASRCCAHRRGETSASKAFDVDLDDQSTARDALLPGGNASSRLTGTPRRSRRCGRPYAAFDDRYAVPAFAPLGDEGQGRRDRSQADLVQHDRQVRRCARAWPSNTPRSPGWARRHGPSRSRRPASPSRSVTRPRLAPMSSANVAMPRETVHHPGDLRVEVATRRTCCAPRDQSWERVLRHRRPGPRDRPGRDTGYDGEQPWDVASEPAARLERIHSAAGARQSPREKLGCFCIFGRDHLRFLRVRSSARSCLRHAKHLDRLRHVPVKKGPARRRRRTSSASTSTPTPAALIWSPCASASARGFAVASSTACAFMRVVKTAARVVEMKTTDPRLAAERLPRRCRVLPPASLPANSAPRCISKTRV